MKIMQHSRTAPTLSHVFHPSFLEASAPQVYGTAGAPAAELSSSHMPDEVTRDCARRMHYAAYRADRAHRRHDADAWRERYFALRERIILGNRKLIYPAVSRYQRAPIPEDLVGDCQLVMIRAVTAYNPWLGIRFSTYACTCLFRALSRLGKRRSIERQCTSLDLDSVADSQAGADLSDQTPPCWPLVLRHLSEDDSLLSAREKRILEHRFGLAGAPVPSTLDQIGAFLGISKERVRQLQTSALGKLRQVLLASASCS